MGSATAKARNRKVVHKLYDSVVEDVKKSKLKVDGEGFIAGINKEESKPKFATF